MIYRNDIEALEFEHAKLATEVAERTRARDEVAYMLLQARDRAAAERHLADLAAGGPRRRRMRALQITASLVVAIAMVGAALYGFRRISRDHQSERMLEVMNRFEGFTTEMCQCSTKQCADGVNERMTKWATELAKDPETSKGTPDETATKKFAEMGQRMGECMTRAMMPPNQN